MRLYVPYTEIQLATRIALRNYPYTPVEITDTYTYRQYWWDRWADGQSFINVEHDVVPWPGALDALWDCPQDWCAYGYHPNDNFDGSQTGPINLFPYLGCVKFSGTLIASTRCDRLNDWLTIDCDLAKSLTNAGYTPHQHRPAVTNANPILIKDLVWQ